MRLFLCFSAYSRKVDSYKKNVGTTAAEIMVKAHESLARIIEQKDQLTCSMELITGSRNSDMDILYKHWMALQPELHRLAKSNGINSVPSDLIDAYLYGWQGT
jgi:hypothetical protein